MKQKEGKKCCPKTLRRKRAPRSASVFTRRAKEYFDKCTGERRTPLLSELVMALGLESRQALEECAQSGSLAVPARAALLQIERGYERLLCKSATGVRFALKCLGWNEKPPAIRSTLSGLDEELTENVVQRARSLAEVLAGKKFVGPRHPFRNDEKTAVTPKHHVSFVNGKSLPDWTKN